MSSGLAPRVLEKGSCEEGLVVGNQSPKGLVC